MTESIPESLASALQDRYRLVRTLGQGGMATVYLAEDVRHHRQVAVKVLRPELSALLGAERFLTEIEVTANLQHPHLLPLFDSGSADGLLFYVMPFVEGESLRARLQREGPLGVDDAVRIATQVASALDYAHRHGVLHRDIKPENILLQEGEALIADFGIALAMRHAGGERLTQTGLAVGTPHYMSPEQAGGERTLDARSDIYSLACVLYEMLTGSPPHTGTTMQAVITQVMTEEPQPISEHRKSVPIEVDEAVLRALEKLPADRQASAAEFASAIALPLQRRTSTHRVAPRPSAGKLVAMSMGGAVMLAAAVVVGMMFGTRSGESAPAVSGVVHRTTIVLPDSAPISFVGEAPLRVGRRSLALSPDGRTLVYVGWYRGRTHLFVRPLDEDRIRRLEGTEGAYAPFFSPTGRWIAFFSGETLRKVPLDGGIPVELTAAPAAYGGVWLPDGRIIIAKQEGQEHVAVDESSGKATPFSIPFVVRVWSDVLDDTRLLATGHVQSWIVSPSDGSGSRLGAMGFTARESSEHPWASPAPAPAGSPQRLGDDVVLVADFGRLFATPLGPRGGTRQGALVPLDELVRQETWGWSAQFAVGGDGTLVYASGDDAARSFLLVADRSGTIDTLRFERAEYVNPSYSPDGRRIAVTVRTPRGWEVQVLDPAAGTRLVAFRSPTYIENALWTPDGTHLTLSDDSISFDIRASGGAAVSRPSKDWLAARSRDGAWTLMQRTSGAAYGESFIVGPGNTRIPVRPGFFTPDFSPDNRWASMTYIGQRGPETFVRPLTPDGAEFNVTPDGCNEAYWMPSGEELVCFGADGYLYAVPLVFEGSEVRGRARRRLTSVPLLETMGRSWSLSPDGTRLLFVSSPATDTSTRLVVVTNFRSIVDQKRSGAQAASPSP